MSGAPAALMNLVKDLRGLGHVCGVVLPARKGPLVKKLKELDIPTFTEQHYDLSIYPRCINPFKRRRRLRRLQDRSLISSYLNYVIEEFRPDIVHTNVGPLDIAAELCRQKGIPHVWHLREYQDLDFGMKFYPSREKFMELIHGDWNRCIAITQDIFKHWQLRLCDRIIYDGVFDERSLPMEPLDIHANPVMHSAQNTDCKGSGTSGRYFLYAARIEKAKGFDILARAFRRFAQENEDVTLTVAGRPCGFYAFRWKMYCRLHIPKGRIRFIGQSDKVAELMRGAAATIVPSRYEAFGFTTAEAMLNGCPVIGRNTAGTREQFDNGLRQTGREIGIRFGEAGTKKVSKLARELLEKMKFVADSQNSAMLAAMRTAAREVAARNYGSHRCAQQVEEFYKEILADKTRSESL